MSDIAETTIKATIKRTLVKDDGSTEAVRIEAQGEADIRNALQDIANEFVPDTEKTARITFTIEDENGATIDSVNVLHRYPDSDGIERVSLNPRDYQNYEALLDGLDALYEKYLAERQAEAKRIAWEAARREECAGLLDYMAEEKDLPPADVVMCDECCEFEGKWVKERVNSLTGEYVYNETFAAPDGQYPRLRPHWRWYCFECEEVTEHLDFVKDDESGNLYVYDEKTGIFSLYKPDGDGLLWERLHKLNDEEVEALPERIKALRKVGADYREACKTAK